MPNEHRCFYIRELMDYVLMIMFMLMKCNNSMLMKFYNSTYCISTVIML